MFFLILGYFFWGNITITSTRCTDIIQQIYIFSFILTSVVLHIIITYQSIYKQKTTLCSHSLFPFFKKEKEKNRTEKRQNKAVFARFLPYCQTNGSITSKKSSFLFWHNLCRIVIDCATKANHEQIKISTN